MSDERQGRPEPAGVAGGRRAGRRLAHGLILAVSVLFVLSSGWQIVRALFLPGHPGDPSESRSAPPPTCAAGMRVLAQALDRESGHVLASAADPTVDLAEASARFRAGLSPEWDGAEAVQRSCTASPSGTDAWAALARLRVAEEQLALTAWAELRPLRRDLAAHLSTELR